jgi:hypothetical protein
MRGATSQSLFASIQATREQIAPQADAAFAATVQTRIPVARIFGCALEASHQAIVSRFERARDGVVPYTQQPQRARRLLAENVTCGCRRDALTVNRATPLDRSEGNPANVPP